MNKFEKAQASALSEFNKIQDYVAKLEAELTAAREIIGCSHPGYFHKSLMALKEENQELQQWRQDFLEAANTNNLSNALNKTRTAFSNEPTPPTEEELAYEVEQQAFEAKRIAKAKTIKVFDSIIDAISMWSTDGQIAPDVELAIQSALFPTVFERVMKGNSDYYLETIPKEKAEKVVREGRELIRDTRAEQDVFVTDPQHWNDLAPRFQSWVIESMLPDLYGATDKAWLTDEPLSLEKMEVWRDKEASRALELPVIFDAYDNLKQVSDEHEALEIGVAEFYKSAMETRIDTELPVNR